jgi:hypothetical protein
MRRSLFPSLVLLLCPVLPAAAQQVLRQEGRAYAPADGRLLYRETHWLQGPAAARSRLVLYRCVDGRAFARKWMTPQGSPQTPDFAFEDARNGYQEGLQGSATARTVYVRADARADRVSRRRRSRVCRSRRRVHIDHADASRLCHMSSTPSASSTRPSERGSGTCWSASGVSK